MRINNALSPRLHIQVASIVCGLIFACSVQAQPYVGAARVVDGDTIEIDDQRLRFFGIDAPESEQRCLNAEGEFWPCGRASANALRGLIEDHIVRCRQKDTDQYGRPIVICHSEGINLNAAQVRFGWAIAYRYYSHRYVRQERRARAADAGIWRGAFVEPYKWRQGARLSADGELVQAPAADRDCGSFETWRAAQAFYLAHQPGDVHRLDGNNDGEACEGLQ